MNFRTLSIIACVATCLVTLAGCASAPVPPIPVHLLWQDKTFNYDAALVTITKRDLFALNADLQASLKGSRLERAGGTFASTTGSDHGGSSYRRRPLG